MFEVASLGEPWNGWATPAFRLDVMRQVAAAFRGVERVMDGRPAFVFQEGDENEEVVAPDADGLYRTDEWVWQQA